ncbi:hypothetical protein V1498_10725 [Peribacillus sp. SCS-26]|uniref:hypothetical protein n=1 Tax=Paraperibacillus marinus TaxID=3115295 RepID=UPI003905E637
MAAKSTICILVFLLLTAACWILEAGLTRKMDHDQNSGISISSQNRKYNGSNSLFFEPREYVKIITHIN